MAGLLQARQGRLIDPRARRVVMSAGDRGLRVDRGKFYAFMRAMGLVNDHTKDCVIRPEVELARETFTG